MLTWVKIAVRNLAKQRRRSAFTMLAISLGFAGVTVFGGFTRYMFDGLREAYIYVHGNGHLTVMKKGFREKGSLDPARYLLSEAEIGAIREACRGYPPFRARGDDGIPMLTQQLRLSGLISNGEVSTVFVGMGRVASDTLAMLKRGTTWASGMKRHRIEEKDLLNDGKMHGIMVGNGLAAKLNLKAGSDVVLMAPTVQGQMNALNASISSIAPAADEMLSDKLVLVTLGFARSLYDTTGADAVNVLLANDRDTPGAKDALRRLLAAKGLDVEVFTWKEMNPAYAKVAGMFNVIFSFLFVIVFLIVVLSVINTISMAVLERTREVGTLRSLGLRRRGIVIMFATESAILAFFGSMGGLALNLLTVWLVQTFKPMWTPPMLNRPVPLQLCFVPEYTAMALGALLALAVAAAVLPARRAVRMSIIDALGHV